MDEIRAKGTNSVYYPHAFTGEEALRFYRGWRPSKLLVKWWRISLFVKEVYWGLKP